MTILYISIALMAVTLVLNLLGYFAYKKGHTETALVYMAFAVSALLIRAIVQSVATWVGGI